MDNRLLERKLQDLHGAPLARAKVNKGIWPFLPIYFRFQNALFVKAQLDGGVGDCWNSRRNKYCDLFTHRHLSMLHISGRTPREPRIFLGESLPQFTT